MKKKTDILLYFAVFIVIWGGGTVFAYSKAPNIIGIVISFGLFFACYFVMTKIEEQKRKEKVMDNSQEQIKNLEEKIEKLNDLINTKEEELYKLSERMNKLSEEYDKSIREKDFTISCLNSGVKYEEKARKYYEKGYRIYKPYKEMYLRLRNCYVKMAFRFPFDSFKRQYGYSTIREIVINTDVNEFLETHSEQRALDDSIE